MTAITLCMIVKNEESSLELCLHSIASYMDEIVIVDTGSTDATREIALRYTDKVYDFQWVNDFSAARNFAIEKAGNEYILAIDADEITEEINMDGIRKLIEAAPGGIGRLLCINEFTRSDTTYQYSERINRLFSKKYYQYKGIIHEQVTPLSGTEEITFSIPLCVRHFGYEGDLEIRRKKTQRNISLLKKALDSTPDDPYLLYQIGKGYYMEEDYINACDYFGRALYFDLDIRLEYVQDMVESYGYSMINSGQYEAAMQLLNIYEEFSHSADFIFLIALILMNNEEFDRAVDEFNKAATYDTSKMEGVNSFLAFYNIGVIYECLGHKTKAKEYYRKCKDYKPAQVRLNSILI